MPGSQPIGNSPLGDLPEGAVALTGVGGVMTPTSTTGAIALTFVLAGLNCVMTPTSSTGAISIVENLTGVGGVMIPTSSTGAVTVTYNLAGASSVMTPTSSTGALTSQVSLLGSTGTVIPVSSTGAITLGEPLLPANPNNIYVGPPRIRQDGDFTPKRSTEVETFSVDYRNSLPDGVTIVSAVWSVASLFGVNSPDMVVGNPSINGSLVSQRLGAGVAGVTYAPTCAATFSDGQVVVLPEPGAGLLAII